MILGRTEILKEMISGAGALDQNIDAQIAYIRDAANRLTEMVDDLVSDAMADALDITIRREPSTSRPGAGGRGSEPADRHAQGAVDYRVALPDHAAMCDPTASATPSTIS